MVHVIVSAPLHSSEPHLLLCGHELVRTAWSEADAGEAGPDAALQLEHRSAQPFGPEWWEGGAIPTRQQHGGLVLVGRVISSHRAAHMCGPVCVRTPGQHDPSTVHMWVCRGEEVNWPN